MELKRVKIFSFHAEYYWLNLILFTIFCFYAIYFGLLVWKGDFPIQYGEDFLAYWSAGTLANEKGYSEIYDLSELRTVQTKALNALGLPIKVNDPSIPVMPAPILSVFVLPFQLFSKVNPESGYWIWTFFNLAVLTGYLSFFLKKTLPDGSAATSRNKILITSLLFFPVISNLIQGQINVFLLVCVGEFIRRSLDKKPFISGLWLGGLLLKPQLLILIIPCILFMRYWKVLMGFALSSGILLSSSILLSGPAGMKGLYALWTQYSGGMVPNNPENMINWRMIGYDINMLSDSNAGWIITGLGIILTFAAVTYMVKSMPAYGSPRWVLSLLGIFAATLAITWHAHYAMALVLVPFLAHAAINHLLPMRTIFNWVIATSLVWIGAEIFGALGMFIMNRNINDYIGMVLGFSGFIFNLVIVYSVMRKSFNFNKKLVDSTGSL